MVVTLILIYYTVHIVFYIFETHCLSLLRYKVYLQNEKVRLKEALRWRHDIWNLLIYVGLKQVFYDRHGFTDFLCLI